MKKTITLSDSSENPVITLCPGHVTPKEFGRAFKAEGWSESDAPEVRYEYWVKGKTTWRKSLPRAKGARAVTVMDW
jgi:hypothetical protein